MSYIFVLNLHYRNNSNRRFSFYLRHLSAFLSALIGIERSISGINIAFSIAGLGKGGTSWTMQSAGLSCSFSSYQPRWQYSLPFSRLRLQFHDPLILSLTIHQRTEGGGPLVNLLCIRWLGNPWCGERETSTWRSRPESAFSSLFLDS